MWDAFNERGVGDEEEVIVSWIKSNLKGSARLVSRFMPRLVVSICPKEAFELMMDQDFRSSRSGRTRLR